MSGDKLMFLRSLKKGEKYDATNYRLVSLTCICCKTLEHILVSHINKHLALDSILADCQPEVLRDPVGPVCAQYHQQPGWAVYRGQK